MALKGPRAQTGLVTPGGDSASIQPVRGIGKAWRMGSHSIFGHKAGLDE